PPALLMTLLPVAGYLLRYDGGWPASVASGVFQKLAQVPSPDRTLRLNSLRICAHVVGEPSAKKESGPMHARLDRVDRDMECPGDLGVRESFDIAQDQGRAEVRRQLVDSAAQDRVQLGLEGGVSQPRRPVDRALHVRAVLTERLREILPRELPCPAPPAA